MHCTDSATTRLRLMACAAALGLLGACAGKPPAASTPAPARAPAAAPGAAPAAAPAPAPAAAVRAAEPKPAAAPAALAPARAEPAGRTPRYVKLDPPGAPRNANELRFQLARRLVAAHPDTTYMGRPPDRLLAIPVLEIELNADGSVRNIQVLRKPSTGNEATLLAIDAVKRAAPYGDVSKLPKPWKVVETFLFDDNLKFKPRTLDGK